jgi:hypothetical protein
MTRDDSFQLLPAMTTMHPYLKQGTPHLSFLLFEMSSARCPFINLGARSAQIVKGPYKLVVVVWATEPSEHSKEALPTHSNGTIWKVIHVQNYRVFMTS